MAVEEMIKSINSKIWIQTDNESIGSIPCVIDSEELPTEYLSLDKESFTFSGEASIGFSIDANNTKWDQFINRSLVGMS